MIHRATSPISMGRTPGHLSRAIRQHATNVVNVDGSTYVVHILLVAAARASHSFAEANLNEVHMHLHAAESRPEGPAAPSVLKTVHCIKSPSILSNITR